MEVDGVLPGEHLLLPPQQGGERDAGGVAASMVLVGEGRIHAGAARGWADPRRCRPGEGQADLPDGVEGAKPPDVAADACGGGNIGASADGPARKKLQRPAREELRRSAREEIRRPRREAAAADRSCAVADRPPTGRRPRRGGRARSMRCRGRAGESAPSVD